MVHGLATLILEGSLARKLGIPVANDVISTFTRLLGKEQHVSPGEAPTGVLS
jgi:hypothetical protein